MKSLNINDWTISIVGDTITLQENNYIAIFDQEKNSLLFLTYMENGSIAIEKCTTRDIKIKIKYKYKCINIILL